MDRDAAWEVENAVGFDFKTFREKLTQENLEEYIEYLKYEVFGKHWQDESWHEVLRLIAGMIDPTFRTLNCHTDCIGWWQ